MIEGIGEGVIQRGSEWTREAFESQWREGRGRLDSVGVGAGNDLGDFMLSLTLERKADIARALI